MNSPESPRAGSVESGHARPEPLPVSPRIRTAAAWRHRSSLGKLGCSALGVCRHGRHLAARFTCHVYWNLDGAKIGYGLKFKVNQYPTPRCRRQPCASASARCCNEHQISHDCDDANGGISCRVGSRQENSHRESWAGGALRVCRWSRCYACRFAGTELVDKVL